MDALSLGFCSVEADVWLVNDQLLVAHDETDITPSKTLEDLYLKPLARIARTNGGFIFPDGFEFTLLVDIKNSPDETFQVLDSLLEPYGEYLTSYERGVGVHHRGLTILLSGERPIETVESQIKRRVFIDGRSDDLRRIIDSELMPWVSEDWHKLFEWRGETPLSAAESERLFEMISTAHRFGSKLRLWSAPDTPIGWQTLLDHGVDLISTDRLEPLASFLRMRHHDQVD